MEWKKNDKLIRMEVFTAVGVPTIYNRQIKLKMIANEQKKNRYKHANNSQ